MMTGQPLTVDVMTAAALSPSFMGDQAAQTCERLLQGWSGRRLADVTLHDLETVKEVLLPEVIGAAKALALGSSTPPLSASSDEEEDW